MSQDAVARAIEQHRALLWGLCYRMSGCAADADDLVQDVAERALLKPPADTTVELRPWLVRVAMNLSRDHLRRRRRRSYRGTWLPGPASVEHGVLAQRVTAETRYGELESVTAAFLLALEALTPAQRSVLLLRDVVGYSVAETAELLDMSTSNVKTTHHRARASMAGYDGEPADLSEQRLRRHRSALRALLVHLSSRNVDALTALLREDVRALNDSDGKYFAARREVVGRAKVILFHLKVNAMHERTQAGTPRGTIEMLNGEPALVAHWPSGDPRIPARMVVRISIDDDGRIRQLDTVVADRKLSHLRFDGLGGRWDGRELVESLHAALTHRPLWEWVPAAALRVGRAARHAVRRRG